MDARNVQRRPLHDITNIDQLPKGSPGSRSSSYLSVQQCIERKRKEICSIQARSSPITKEHQEVKRVDLGAGCPEEGRREREARVECAAGVVGAVLQLQHGARAAVPGYCGHQLHQFLHPEQGPSVQLACFVVF